MTLVFTLAPPNEKKHVILCCENDFFHLTWSISRKQCNFILSHQSKLTVHMYHIFRRWVEFFPFSWSSIRQVYDVKTTFHLWRLVLSIARTISHSMGFIFMIILSRLFSFFFLMT
jgi:hypothetical protein